MPNVGKVRFRLGSSPEKLTEVVHSEGFSVTEAAAALGGIVFNESVVVRRHGIWYLFSDRSFKHGADDVLLADGDDVFYVPDDMTYDQLALRGIKFVAGTDAINALKVGETAADGDVVKPAPAAVTEPAPMNGAAHGREKTADTTLVASQAAGETRAAAPSLASDGRQSSKVAIWTVVGGAVLLGLFISLGRKARRPVSKRSSNT